MFCGLNYPSVDISRELPCCNPLPARTLHLALQARKYIPSKIPSNSNLGEKLIQLFRHILSKIIINKYVLHENAKFKCYHFNSSCRHWQCFCAFLCECSLERKHIAGADLMIPRRFFLCVCNDRLACIRSAVFFFYVQRPARLARQVVYKMVSNRAPLSIF